LAETPSGRLGIDCEAACPYTYGEITWLDPREGVVDARQPHPVSDATELHGIDTIIVAAPNGADVSCWSLCETNQNPPLYPPYPPELENNDIRSVLGHGDGTYTITLNRPITPGEVTGITYTDVYRIRTTGHFIAHPGNVNGDNVADPGDIVALIGIINRDSVSPWGTLSEDLDHSGSLAPGDILALIDLLNGGDTFAPGWNGTALPGSAVTCP
jgi:hypothetical protein